MSLDVTIHFKEPRLSNYFLEHPYSYSGLSDRDMSDYRVEVHWSANITHNLGEMASHVPIRVVDGTETTLYMVCWRPAELGLRTAGEILPLINIGLVYMLANRKVLLKYNSPNGWGTYDGFMKFLLNYKQALEDADPDSEVTTDR